METSHPKKADWRQWLAAELRRDKKKTALMVVLAAVATGVFVQAARPTSTSPVQAASSAIKVPAAASASGSRAGEPASAAPGRQDAAKPPAKPASGVKITRDIFEPNPAYFPAQVAPRAPSPAAPPSEETPTKAKERTIRAQADSLRLQSTIASALPTAIINDLVLRQGDSVEGFRVIEIGTRTCVLEKQGVRVTLELRD